MQRLFDAFVDEVAPHMLEVTCEGMLQTNNVISTKVRLHADLVAALNLWFERTLKPFFAENIPGIRCLVGINKPLRTVLQQQTADSSVEPLAVDPSFATSVQVSAMELSLKTSSGFTEDTKSGSRIKKRVNASSFDPSDCPDTPFFFEFN
jgi:hypothetical protein